MKASPTRLEYSAPRRIAVASHRSASPPSPPTKRRARSSRVSQSATCACRSACLACVASSVACKVESSLSTAASCSFFAASAMLTCRYSASALARRSRLGRTTLATVSYSTIARTHRHSPSHALLTVRIFSWLKSLPARARKSSILSTVACGMLSLSYASSRSRNLMPAASCLRAGSQYRLDTEISSPSSPPSLALGALEGGTCSIMHTASIVSLTPIGGVLNIRTSTMSSFLSVASALDAAASAGSAEASSAVHSSLMASAEAACASAAVSSASTSARVFSASALSRLITSKRSSASLCNTRNLGCSSVSSMLMAATCSAVDASFSSPPSYLLLRLSSASLRALSRFANVLSSSR
mmetsp:Transcript_24516/g.62062  ORF Transcript_24516/g.62062 Transcript_24516/m.62062 type:complete len:356 (-) Transcript_24516:376-1443(-)